MRGTRKPDCRVGEHGRDVVDVIQVATEYQVALGVWDKESE